MAYLTKDQYEYRRESAARRNIHNVAVAVEHGMAEKEAELIANFAALVMKCTATYNEPQ